MSARRIGRGYGIVIRCNYDGCDARYQTANIVIGANRAAAAKVGWIRGGKGRKHWDVCPTHTPEERALVKREAEERELRKRQRDERRKARMQPKPPKQPKARRTKEPA